MTDNTTGSDNGLQGAFGDRGTNVNAIGYGHPNGDKIIEEAFDILGQSKTGQIYLKVLNQFKIPIHMMNGMNESGFSSDMKTIFLQVPKPQKTISGDILFNLIKALSEADQEFSGLTAPNPMTDVMGYATFMHRRNLDSLTHTCMVIKELTDTEFHTILLDSLNKFGLNGFYRAYIDGVSREELYDHYAEAYSRRSN